MPTYDVYTHQELGYQAVKRGFSWPAFVFGMFWAFYKKLWLVGAVYLLIALLFSISIRDDGEGGLAALYNFVSFAISLFVGAAGNGWWRDALGEQGYRHTRAVEALTPRAAIESVFGPQESAPF